MILRRLTIALSKQHWGTVVIETLIVVFDDIDIHPFQGRNTP